MHQNSDQSATLSELEKLRESSFARVSQWMELPEPRPVLDLDSRRGSTERMFKHLHQMIVPHQMNYVASNRVKHLLLIDALLAMARAENPLGLYAIARSMFELNAFLHDVQVRLTKSALPLTENTWVPVGENFFGLIVRARFATTHPEHRAALLKEGIAESRLKPFNIAASVKSLSSEPEHLDAGDRYELLCDFVHHNLGSNSAANSGSGVADVARHASGGGFVSSAGSLTYTRYEYPLPSKFAVAFDAVAPAFLRDAQACLEWLRLTPESPFSPDLVQRMTGHAMGMKNLQPPLR